MKPGYKQTEVGVIPEEWDVVQLGDLKPFVTSGSRGWASYYAERGFLFVRITNLSRESIYLDLTDSKFVKLPPEVSEGVRTQLKEHDVLISITADIGIVGYVDASVPSPAYINQHIALVRFNPSQASGKFVSYFLASEKPQRLFRASTDVGAKAGMSLITVQKIQTALPPPPEQRAIATALSDVDGLLGGLDRLIAKKRDLKQAAMQQLLTGQTRLPGFSEQWETTRVGTIMREGKKTQRHAGMGERAGAYRFFTNNTQDNETYINEYDYCGEAVIANTGGTAFFQYYRGCFAASMHCLILFSDINVKFLYFVLKVREVEINERCFQGSGLKVLNKRTLRDLVLTVPKSIGEQSAIADVLTCMDAELEALQSRRDKTARLKQAMMQELLTGRIRLLPAEARHA